MTIVIIHLASPHRLSSLFSLFPSQSPHPPRRSQIAQVRWILDSIPFNLFLLLETHSALCERLLAKRNFQHFQPSATSAINSLLYNLDRRHLLEGVWVGEWNWLRVLLCGRTWERDSLISRGWSWKWDICVLRHEIAVSVILVELVFVRAYIFIVM